jgi:hypothetical protein
MDFSRISFCIGFQFSRLGSEIASAECSDFDCGFPTAAASGPRSQRAPNMVGVACLTELMGGLGLYFEREIWARRSAIRQRGKVPTAVLLATLFQATIKEGIDQSPGGRHLKQKLQQADLAYP